MFEVLVFCLCLGAFGVVFDVCLFCLIVCACLMACSLVVVIIVLVVVRWCRYCSGRYDVLVRGVVVLSLLVSLLSLLSLFVFVFLFLCC